jgi:aspartyl-tRNA(Asn)/glutamyl-tRNA(Gln) amidotransferase subunit A
MCSQRDALTIESFGRRLRARETTAAELTDACLERIEAEQARLNAFVFVMGDEARARARRADRELATGIDHGPLHGVPISVKDLIDIRGVPTTAASRVREGLTAEHDAPTVARLRRAGAVLVGKTNLHEFALGTTSEDSAFGPTRNPWDPSRSPGGSSGGSAVSVAVGMALATVGTDTGGSIRIPAAACGIVGFKPTYGEVPVDDVVPLSRSLDHVGPLAGTVTDAWLTYRALVGDPQPGPLDPAPLPEIRLTLPRAYFCELLDDDVRARFEAALDRLQQAGARVTVAEIPHAAEIASIYIAIGLSEAAAYHAATLEEMPDRYSTPVRMRLEAGRYLLAEDYIRAMNGREVLRREVDSLLTHADAIILPTLPIPAPPIGAESLKLGDREESVRTLMLRLTQLFNLTGHPAFSIPCGLTAAGLPCGLQLVGARMESDALARLALACERELNSATV